MRNRPKIFWTNYHNLKKRMESVKEEPLKGVLYTFMKYLQEGKYEKLDDQLRLCPTDLTKNCQDWIYKTLDVYMNI